MEFEIIEPHGAPRVGAIVTLLDDGTPVGRQVVPASGFVTFDNLIEGEVYSLEIEDTSPDHQDAEPLEDAENYDETHSYEEDDE